MTRQIAVIDCETDPFLLGRVPEPFLWGFYDGRNFRHYTHDTLPSLLEYIASANLVVYAHNGGKFDFHFLLDALEPYSDIMIINGRISKFFIGNSEFRDSYNILPVPLKKIVVNDSGEVYKKQEFDYSDMEKSNRYKPEVWPRIVSYLEDDCITLYKAIALFEAEYGRNLTVASAAMACWKKMQGPSNPIPNSSAEFFQIIRPYYYGGRVECFQSGIIERDFSVYDINSAYPRAMLESHPYGLDYEILANFDNSRKIPPAFLHIRAQSQGAFPFRDKSGRLMFPADGETRDFFITYWEYEAAKDTNTLGECEIVDVVYFNRYKNFSDYVAHFYEKRKRAKKNGDSAGDLFAKIMLTGLYGKFGSNPDNYAKFMNHPLSDFNDLINSDDMRFSGMLGDWLLSETELDEDEKKFYNVATAASITGYVRAQLWRSIHDVGIGNMLYCDTDSVAFSGVSHSLIVGDGLGEWKHEGEFIRAGIGGKKMYVFEPKSGKLSDYKTASKGVRLTIDELWKIARGETVTYCADSPVFSVHKKPEFVTKTVRMTR